MKCEEIQEYFGAYFDLTENDQERLLVDEHLKECPSCREEFEMWRESADLIRLASNDQPAAVPSPVSKKVMERIYHDESWRLPVVERIYSFPYKLRRNLIVVISFCLALFMFSFLYSIISGSPDDTVTQYGLQQAARASADPADDLNVHTMTRIALASAGPTIIDPVKIGPINTAPDYWLSVSLLGLITTLLIINWLSRTRS